MPTSLSLSIPDLESITTAEARVSLLELATRITAARAAADGATRGASMANTSIRNALAGNVRQKLVTALAQEERETVQFSEAITKNKEAGLDAVAAALGTARTGGESDADLRVRLDALNDLEAKPLRSAIRDAADAMLDTLLTGPGPVMDLVSAVSVEMGA